MVAGHRKKAVLLVSERFALALQVGRSIRIVNKIAVVFTNVIVNSCNTSSRIIIVPGGNNKFRVP